MFKNLLRSAPAHIAAASLLERERPELPATHEPLAPETGRSDQLSEYSQLSKSLGFVNPHIDADLKVERFKAFLRQKDWPVFALPTVIAYMDKKAEAESEARAGWHWRPLREKDHLREAAFGQAAHAWSGQGFASGSAVNAAQAQAQFIEHRVAASDHYAGARLEKRRSRQDGYGNSEFKDEEVAASAAPYNKLVPLHALRKVAEIENGFKEPVSFFVCDYAPAPHIEHPDPFLMAVINNGRLREGVGRFVIDFWDEPGFGLSEQL